MKKITFFMALVAIAFSIRAQYSNSTFLLTEGQYGSSSGGLYWLNPENQTFGSCVSDEINSTGYGETPIFASFFGDELFVVSKQQGSYGGGVLTIADAYSFKNIYTFTTMSDDGHNYDGRTFCGLTETKGYMGTSNGIFVVDLENYEVVKLIEGTDCGYGVGESINGGYYQYDVYYHQIGTMVRVGNYVFVSQQNKGVLVIDIEIDEIIYTISAEEFGGSFGDLVMSKDGMLWTTACATENYSYEHTPEQNVLIMIDPNECVATEKPTENKVSVAWSTWRTPMMQACEHSNKILWKDVCYFDWMMYEQVGKPQILYYDIDNDEEGVFVDVSTIDPNYTIYSGFSVDPETDNVYVPVSSNAGYGPWFLLIFSPEGELIGEPISIPIGDWSDYPAMVLFTDDYAPEFNLQNKYELSLQEKFVLNLADVVTDKDSPDAGIIVEVIQIDDPELATVEITGDKTLEFWMREYGCTTVTLRATSNGKSVETSVILDNLTTAVESVEIDENAAVEYYNLQGVRVVAPVENGGVYIKKQGAIVTKVVM